MNFNKFRKNCYCYYLVITFLPNMLFGDISFDDKEVELVKVEIASFSK